MISWKLIINVPLLLIVLKYFIMIPEFDLLVLNGWIASYDFEKGFSYE